MPPRRLPVSTRRPAERLDDGLVRNQFGGVLGGKIIQDKLFFFGAYQASRSTQTPADLVAFIPTAAMMAGDFTAVTAPACNRGTQVNLRAPFVNNRLAPAEISPAALAVARRLPVTSDPCGRITYSTSDQAGGDAVNRQGRLADQPEPVAVRPLHADHDVLGPAVRQRRQPALDVARRPRQRRALAGDWPHHGAEQHDGEQRALYLSLHQRAPHAHAFLRPGGRRDQELQLRR